MDNVEKSSELVLDLQVQNEYYKRVVKTTTHTGVSSNGKISVSKTAHGGSNPSTPAKEKESDDGLVPFFVSSTVLYLQHDWAKQQGF